MNEDNIKHAVCCVTAAFVSFCVVNLTFALLAWALWAWLAYILAVVAGVVVGVAAGEYMEFSGYDAAVSVAGRGLSFLRGLRAKAAA